MKHYIKKEIMVIFLMQEYVVKAMDLDIIQFSYTDFCLATWSRFNSVIKDQCF